MSDKFDELAKGLAQSATRRHALKKFGVGLAGLALASFAMAKRAEAAQCKPDGASCGHHSECCSGDCERMISFGPLSRKFYCV